MNTITMTNFETSSQKTLPPHPVINNSEYKIIPYHDVAYYYVNTEGKTEFIDPVRIRSLALQPDFRSWCSLPEFDRWWEMKMMLPNGEVLPASLPLVSDMMYLAPNRVVEYVEEMALLNRSSSGDRGNIFPKINGLKLDYSATPDAVPSVHSLSPAAGLGYRWLGCTTNTFKLMTGIGTRKIKFELDWEASIEGKPIQYKAIVTDVKAAASPVIPNNCGIIYTCRGVGRPEFHDSFSRLIREHDPSFVVLTETRVNSEIANDLYKSIWPSQALFAIEPQGYCGGVTILWNPERIKLVNPHQFGIYQMQFDFIAPNSTYDNLEVKFTAPGAMQIA